jgi:hypothetical protein
MPSSQKHSTSIGTFTPPLGIFAPAMEPTDEELMIAQHALALLPTRTAGTVAGEKLAR